MINQNDIDVIGSALAELKDAERNAKNAYEICVSRKYEEDIKDSILEIIHHSKNLRSILEKLEPEQQTSPTKSNLKYRGGHNIRERIDDEKREDVYTVAYWMSKYEHRDILPSYTQTEAFSYISDVLGVKHNYLKNTRDTFDSHTGSHRKGWDARMNELMKKLFLDFEEMEKTQVLERVRQILVKYNPEFTFHDENIESKKPSYAAQTTTPSFST